MTNLVCAGFGGQGVLTAGLIIAKTGMDIGKNVVWIPSYGSEMRGGTANCNVKISEEEIASPFIRSIDVLLELNEPSVDKFQGSIAPGGTMIINSSIVKREEFRPDIHVYAVEATGLAAELENSRGANIVMIGAFSKTTGVIGETQMEEGIENFFLSKGKCNPKNRECFAAGIRSVRELQRAVV